MNVQEIQNQAFAEHFSFLPSVYLIYGHVFYCRYCDTINTMVHVMQQRQIQPQYQFEAIFAMSSMKKDYDQALATLHKFTKRVIR